MFLNLFFRRKYLKDEQKILDIELLNVYLCKTNEIEYLKGEIKQIAKTCKAKSAELWRCQLLLLHARLKIGDFNQ